MEGEEKKPGLKKRSKPIAIGLDSDEDEPIGSLLKAKKMRNPKKVKMGLEVGGEKSTKSNVKMEKMVIQSVDLGGMDDTLANFKKKLKGPKKDSGSVNGRVMGSAMNTIESTNGSPEDETDAEMPSKILGSGQEVGVDGSNDAALDGGYENKGKVRRRKFDYQKKAVKNWAATDDGLESLGSERSPPEDKKVAGTGHGEGSSHSVDENVEDSLSAIFPKTQSGSIKKSRASPSMRQKSGNLKMKDGLNPRSEAVVEGFHSVTVRGPALASSPNQRLEDSAPNCPPLGSQTEGTVDCTCGSDEVCNGDAKLCSCHEVKDKYDEIQTLGTQNFRDGLKHCSIGKSNTFLQDDEIPNSTSAPMDAEENHVFCKGESKRHRDKDMIYEGDAGWENLMHEQKFIENEQVIDKDRPSRVRDKFSSAFINKIDAETCGAAAVSAGLKAHAIGPVERIKFKEVLKRKGGVQEYLECRNQILGLWSKDVSRILPLTECGVHVTPENEPSCAYLIKDIYTFLDQSGYINVGIASKKDKGEPSAKHNYKLLEEKKFEASSGASVADSEEGVSFILGQEKTTTHASIEEKNGVMAVDEYQALETTKDKAAFWIKSEDCPGDHYQENGSIDAKPPNKTLKSDIFSTVQSSEMLGSGTVLVTCPELMHDSHSVQSASSDHVGVNHDLQCDSEVRKRIIVIGAGPAGLTAARHLQRQGFCVTVLEARSRIGGRVYTDRSSLSVPVDLGASIITGVEADVDTERRPDPSSLVCAQLGLELTVLNSDCPLYDIVTGHKVPADLDEALEAEYNGLLDDMVLLVAQKGEQAMRMSLEDGLEYALSRRRMARLGINSGETDPRNQGDATFGSKKLNIDGRVQEKRYCEEEILSPLERRVMDWHFAHLEYGCAALLKEVSLPYWNQDDIYGGFGGAHCMIKGGYSSVVESLGEGLSIHLNHIVTDVSYAKESRVTNGKCSNVTVSTSNGSEFSGDAVLITVPLGCLKAEAINFSPPLPQWKLSSVQRLGFGVLNKVVLEFLEIFWDDSVDYFGATAEETNLRGQCFMFWNVRKTVGAPVLIALLVGKAAIDGQNVNTSDHVSHALMVLRKLFGESSVPDPVASVVTDWGRDPFSYGAYSYVAVGASGEDYDILGRPVDNCLFFAGEATCKEHPDTVGGAMMSGLREAVRIIDILMTGNDYTAEIEAMKVAQRQTDSERDEVRDITMRLDAVEVSNALYKSSLDGTQILTREALLQDMFFNAKTTAGRLHLAKDLLHLPVETLKSFAGTRKGLATLNSWILDSMGKDGTQLLRLCVRLLVRVSTDLLAVRLSGIGKTVKEKVCVHTSRDIRAIASQLVNVWLEVFRKEKASNSRLKLLRQTAVDSTRSKIHKDPASGKPPLRTYQGAMDSKGSLQVLSFDGCQFPKKVNGKPSKFETINDSKSEVNSSKSGGSIDKLDDKVGDNNIPISEEEEAAFAAAEAARAAALAAAEAYASSGAKGNASLQLPKIPSFHKFARREQYAQMDESDFRRKWSGGVLGRQDCISEIDSRNCRVRDWSLDFSAACVNLDSSKLSVDNLSQRSHSNEVGCQMNFREHSGESAAVDSSILTKAWVDTAGSVGVKDYHAIERWQSQAAAADSDFFLRAMHMKDEEDSNTSSKLPTWKHSGLEKEGSVSQVTINKELQPRGVDDIKQAVVDYVASLLMPLYKSRKIDKEGYKSIMKKTATKVMEQATDAEKAMVVPVFLDSKRRNKIRSFVDKLIERHMSVKPPDKSR